MKRIKTIFLVLVLSIVVGVGSYIGYLFWSDLSSSRIVSHSTDLSDRALEFYKEQKQIAGSPWQGINLEGESNSNVLGALDVREGDKMYATNCFQVVVPFAHFNPKVTSDSGKCEVWVAMGDKLWGHFMVLAKKVPGKSIRDDSGVKLRLLKPEKYTAWELPVKGFDDYVAFSAKGEKLILLQKDDYHIMISFSEMSDATSKKINEYTVMRIIDSLKFVQ